MARLFKWMLRLFLGLVVLTFLFGFVAYQLAARSLPDYDAEYTVAGLTAPVEIIRDNADVPHIFGATDADVFFGLGFAQAQDRLWQMMLMRRTAQGRLSELFGARTLDTDELLRRLDLYGLAVQSVDALAPDTRAALDAFSAGVNAWIEQVNAGALGRGAPEFFIFPSAIAPWQPADSVAIAKLMALQMAGHLQHEVLLARTSLLLPPERVRDIIPDSPGEGISDLPAFAALFAPGTQMPRLADLRSVAGTGIDPVPDRLSPVPAPGMDGASNAWAAAPARSASGGTLLANDPHLGFSAPGVWYLARIELSTGGVIGGTIPGMPVVLVGRSDALGWGLTSAYVDDQDLFTEEINPDQPDEVRTPQGWKALATRPSIIRIKGAAPVTVNLQWSDNGPVLPGKYYDLAAITPPGHLITLGWTALSARDTSMDFGMRLMRASTVDAAIDAGESFIAPAQNLTVVDRGRIAMKTIGAIPRRALRHQSQGQLPAPGWLAQNRWQGRLGYDANPEFRDPAGGIVGNTNNKTLDRPFPFNVSAYWGDTQRIQRWRHLMQSREVHTRESFIEAQLDQVSFTARSLLPLIAADLCVTGDPAPDGTPERQRQRALELLAAWNGEMNEHMPEPLIYAAWMRALQDRLIRDEMGPLARAFDHVDPVFIERVYRDIDGAAIWCDVLQSAQAESCTDIARQSLDAALIWIAENHGAALESLRWGDAHQATHDHSTLGQVALLRYFVNIRQSTSGGDQTLMRGRTSGKDPAPFQNVHGAGFRGVYDFADPDSSVFVTATGQSGHFLSRHYDDLGVLWRRGEYIPMSLDVELARGAAVGVNRLEPAD